MSTFNPYAEALAMIVADQVMIIVHVLYLFLRVSSLSVRSVVLGHCIGPERDFQAG